MTEPELLQANRDAGIMAMMKALNVAAEHLIEAGTLANQRAFVASGERKAVAEKIEKECFDLASEALGLLGEACERLQRT